jgi:hypothetical protein
MYVSQCLFTASRLSCVASIIHFQIKELVKYKWEKKTIYFRRQRLLYNCTFPNGHSFRNTAHIGTGISFAVSAVSIIASCISHNGTFFQFDRIRMNPTSGKPGAGYRSDLWKNQGQKIAWHSPFKLSECGWIWSKLIFHDWDLAKNPYLTISKFQHCAAA